MNICLVTVMFTQKKEAAGKRERIAFIRPTQGESVGIVLVEMIF